eukprot:1518191-Pleurochrysis_carterae.AAC.1
MKAESKQAGSPAEGKGPVQQSPHMRKRKSQEKKGKRRRKRGQKRKEQENREEGRRERKEGGGRTVDRQIRQTNQQAVGVGGGRLRLATDCLQARAQLRLGRGRKGLSTHRRHEHNCCLN